MAASLSLKCQDTAAASFAAYFYTPPKLRRYPAAAHGDDMVQFAVRNVTILKTFFCKRPVEIDSCNVETRQ